MNIINEKNIEEQFILIVDNGLTDLKSVFDILKEESPYARFASDTETALKILVKTKPLLILIGLIMPKMDSYTFTRILKNDENTRDITIIALSGTDSDHEKAISCGFDGFVNTKESGNIVVKKIKKILDNKKISININ